MAKSVKLADIAEVVGVSIVTVSKALSGKSGVGDEMREKIKKIADEMGYRPASVPKFQRLGSTGNIGVLVAKRYLDQTSFYWQLYQKIINIITKNGYYAILEILDEENEKNNVLPKIICDKKIDGMISLGQTIFKYTAFLENNITIPLMFLDFYSAANKLDTVISDGYYGMYQLANYVISKGHKEIGFVGTVLATSSITDRYFGFCKAMKENDLQVLEEWVIDDRMLNKETLVVDISVELPEKLPTAFVCNCDLVAYKVIKKLQERGLSVPEDISVTGYDNFAYPDPSNIPLTTYDVGMKKMATTCVETLLKKMSDEYYYKGAQIVTGQMIIRDSVKDIANNE
ncbi:MAG: LacI family DNA-binding transcriptional regulator [Lachnospiraceae bacterium]|nr:LacI family DNA-binding transcriptional regulator [Lachnospiraceae bacterium]